MTEESVVVICPNPRCGKEIREPMLLTILCVTPPEQYEACPYCFAKLQPEEYPEEPEEPELDAQPEPEADLDKEPEPEELEAEDPSEDEDLETEESYQEEKLQDILPEDDSFEEKPEAPQSFFDRVKSLIPSGNGSKKEKAREPETVSIVEPEDISDEDEDDQYDEAEDEVEDEELEADDETEELDEPEEEDAEEDFEDEEEEPEEEPKAKEPSQPETKQQGCPEEFGYLANREKDVPIPAVCYMCPRMVDCMLSPRDD